MSTILDALKKSEQERKLNKLPTLTDIAAPQEPSRWPIFIGVALLLLATALVILAYVIWSARPPIAGVNVSHDDNAALKPSASLTNNLATEVVVSEAQAQGEQSSSTIDDAMLVGVVSYSDDPALRFAMVNGKMVREGEFIDTGLKVEQIRFDAVVFNARGEKIIRSP